MKYFTILFIVVVFVAACTAAIAQQEDLNAAIPEKKTEKRGIYGLGYGHGYYGGFGGYGHYDHGFGYPHYPGYAVHAPYYGHGYYPYHGSFYHGLH